MRGLGIFVYVIAGIIGMFGAMGIVIKELGFVGGLVAFIFFPVTLAFAPWYAGFAYDNWNLLAIVYGGGILGAVLVSAGGD